MTHGDIYLPLNPGDPASRYLYCEAWSDGYMDGVGYGCLGSSVNIAGICAASAMFAGSPFFWDAERGAYVAKEEDYVIDNFADSGADDALCESAEEALRLLIEEGSLDRAAATDFGRMPLEQKLDAGYGLNAQVLTREEAFENFSSSYGDAVILDDEQAARAVAQCIGSETADMDTHTCYFWDGSRFLATVGLSGVEGIDGVDPEGEETVAVIPLVAAACMGSPSGCVVDLGAYLASPSEADAKMLKRLMDELEKAGHADPAGMLFDGAAAGPLRALRERDELDKMAQWPAAKVKGAGL